MSHVWKNHTFLQTKACVLCQSSKSDKVGRSRYRCQECHASVCKKCRKADTALAKIPCRAQEDPRRGTSSFFRFKAKRADSNSTGSVNANGAPTTEATLQKSRGAPSQTTRRLTTVVHSSTDVQQEAADVKSERGSTVDASDISELVETEVYEWGGPSATELCIRKLLPRKRVLQIDSSGKHAAVLTRENQVYIWGEGSTGQLGFGRDVRLLEQPKLLECLSDKLIGSIACGPTATAAITTDGRVYMWGYRFDEQQPLYEPEPFEGFPLVDEHGLTLVQGEDYRVLQLCFSPNCGAALIDESAADGESDIQLWTWGQELLGHGPGVTSCKTPRRVDALRDHNVVQVACGDRHSAALTDQGRIYVWGRNIHQELPDLPLLGVLSGNEPSQASIIHEPQLVAGIARHNFVFVSCGSWHTVALTDKGEIFSWGYGHRGYLGHGNLNSLSTPTMIEGLRDKVVVGVECGGQHVVAWTDTGEIYSWGRRGCFKLGHANDEDISSPKLIESVCRAGQENKIVYGISANFSSTLAFLGIDRARLVFGNEEAMVAARDFPTVGDLLKFASSNWAVDESDLMLLNCTGQSLARTQNVRTLIFEEELDPTFMVRSRSALWAQKKDGLNFEKLDGTMQVASGRLRELVTWLTYHEFTGTQFKAAFLLTFRTMGLEPARLLEMLIKRYQEPLSAHDSEHDSTSKAGQLKEKIARIEREQHTKCVRARVLDVIGKWITTYPADFINGKVSSSLIIETLLQFLENEAMRDFDTKAKRIRRSMLFELGHMQSRADEQLPTQSDYPEPKPLHEFAMDFWKYSPVDMARQITCMDFYKFFKYLREHEFLDCAWMKSNKEEVAPNILRLIRRFNNGAEWVAAEVLQGETAELRVARAEKLIDVADELLKLHNYSSMMMIVSGFMSTPVYRLKTLWEDISSKHFKKLQNMRTILDATGNHANYRKHFASVPSPKLPFIGLYLTDLVYLQEDPDTVKDPDSGESFINFRKRLKIAQIILNFKSLQTIPYVIKPHQELWNYLWMIRGFQNHENTAYQLSKSIDSADEDSVVMVPAPVLSETVIKQYSTVAKAAPVAEDAQVALLNGQARVACLRRKDRRRVWKQWLAMLEDSSASQLLEEGEPTMLQGTTSFRTLFCLSVALEYSVKSALLSWPAQRVTAVDSEDSDYVLLRKLLLTMRCSVVHEDSVDALLDALQELARVKVSDEAFEPVFSLISVWKSTCLIEEAVNKREQMQAKLLDDLAPMMESTSPEKRLDFINELDERYSTSQVDLESWSKYEGLTTTLQSSLSSSTVSVFEDLRLTLVRSEAEKAHAGYLKRYRKVLREQREIEDYLRVLEQRKAFFEDQTAKLNADLTSKNLAPLPSLATAVESDDSRMNSLFQVGGSSQFGKFNMQPVTPRTLETSYEPPQFPSLSKFLGTYHDPVLRFADVLVARSASSSDFLRRDYPRLLMKQRLKLQVDHFEVIKAMFDKAPAGAEKDALWLELQDFNKTCANLRHAIFDLEEEPDAGPNKSKTPRSRSDTLAYVVSNLVDTGQKMARAILRESQRRELPSLPAPPGSAAASSRSASSSETPPAAAARAGGPPPIPPKPSRM